MKIILLLILFPMALSAQKVKVETDKFTHETRITSDHQFMQMGLGSQLGFKLWSVGNHIFFNIDGVGEKGGHTIGENDELLLLLDNDQTLRLQSKGIQQYNLHQSSFGMQKVFNYDFVIAPEDVEALAGHTLRSFRIPGQEGYSDFDVKEGKASKFMAVAAGFNDAFKTNATTATK
jgi:hypothetical protein